MREYSGRCWYAFDSVYTLHVRLYVRLRGFVLCLAQFDEFSSHVICVQALAMRCCIHLRICVMQQYFAVSRIYVYVTS